MQLQTFLTLLLICQTLSLSTGGKTSNVKLSKANNCSTNNGDCSSCLSELNLQHLGICGYCQPSDGNCSVPSRCPCLDGGLYGPSDSSCERSNWYYEACPDQPTEQTVTYTVSLRLLNVAAVDLKAGTFSADFLIYFEGNRVAYTERECKSDSGVCFNILNSVGAPIIVKYQTYFHVQGTFSFEVDLSDYPFDNQTLQLLIQDSYNSALELQWMLPKDKDDKTGIDSHLTLSGWNYDSNSWVDTLSQRYNPILDENFSTFVFKFLIQRPQAVGFIKGLLPPLFIVLVICASFSLPAKEMSSRIWIGGSLLISVVLFHSTLAEETPRKGQLTFADNFIISVYVFIFISLAVNIVIIRLFRSGAEKLASKIQHITEIISWPALFIFFFGHFYLKWNTVLVIFLVAMSSLVILVCIFVISIVSSRKKRIWCKSCFITRQNQNKFKDKEGILDEGASPFLREEKQL